MFYKHLQSLKQSVLSEQDKPSDKSKKQDLFFSTVLNKQETQSNMSMLLNLQKTNEFLQQQNKSTMLQNKKLSQELIKKQTQCIKLNQTIQKIRSQFQSEKAKFFQLFHQNHGNISEELLQNEQQIKERIITMQLEIQRNIQEKQILKEVYMQARDNMIEQVSILRIQSSKKDRIIDELKQQLKQKDTQLTKKQQQIQNLKKHQQTQVIKYNHSHHGPSSSLIDNAKNHVGCSGITSSTDKNTKRRLSFDFQGNAVLNQDKIHLQKIEEQSNTQNTIAKLIDGFSYSKDYYKLALAEQKYKMAKLQKQHRALLIQYQDLQQKNKDLDKTVKKHQQRISLLEGKEESYDILFEKQQKKIENMIKMYDNELESFRQIQNEQLSKKWLDQYHRLQQSLKQKNNEIQSLKQKHEEQLNQLHKKIRQMQRQQKLIFRQNQSPKNIQKIHIPIEIEKRFQKSGLYKNKQSQFSESSSVKNTPEYTMIQKQLSRYKNLYKNEKLNHEKIKNYHEALLKVLEKAKTLNKKDSNEIVDDAINWVKRTSSQLSRDHENNHTLYCRKNVISRVQQNSEFNSQSIINPQTPILHLQNLKDKVPQLINNSKQRYNIFHDLKN